MPKATIAISARPEHQFDPAPLHEWLQHHAPQFGALERLEQIEGGQSNPTYRLICSGGELALRKQPPGALLPSAHRIDREWRLLSALHGQRGSPVPVPPPVAWCADAELLGTPFYLTAWVDGVTFDTPDLPDFEAPARRAAYIAYFETLAAIHAVPPATVGLADFGRAEGYVTRQIARWSAQYDASATRNIPAFDELRAALTAWSPPDAAPTIVHGDYRFANVIFAPDGSRTRAVVDWELATLGHPLSDLAFACVAFRCEPNTPGFPGIRGLSTSELGILTEPEAIQAYNAAGGMAVPPDWPTWVAYACFRLAAISQGVYRRGTEGQASSAYWHNYGPAVDVLAAKGLESLG